MTKLGLIAGNGSFPLEVAAAARRRAIPVIAIAHVNETDPALASVADEIAWVKIGELQKTIDLLKATGVDQAAMAGGISRARLAESFTPDARAIKMLQSVGRLSDDAILRAVAREIEADGIPVIDPVPMLDDALAGAGVLAGAEPNPAQMRDLALAFAIMSALGRFDIGQAVAVRDGVVAAIEAVEGTDSALRRAANLWGKGIVVAKASKPGQDLRFDRPAVGPATLELLGEIGAAVLGVEAGVALLLQRDRTLARAAELGITVYGYG